MRAINTVFNETELAIFHRQTDFTFDRCWQSGDGKFVAVDNSSGQIFIGDDLLKSNVRPLDSIVSAGMKEDNTMFLIFSDSLPVALNMSKEDAEEILSELNVPCGDDQDEVADCETGPVEPFDDGMSDSLMESPGFLTDEDLNEVYSRLLNAGRDEAVAYLVRNVGMNSADAVAYVNGLDGQDQLVESVPDPVVRADGTMTRNAILSVLEVLKPGDRIHLEYKPMLGKLRVYDTSFLKLSVETWSRDFSMNVFADDYGSMIEELITEMFDYMNLYFYCEENSSEICCHLKRVTKLKKL